MKRLSVTCVLLVISSVVMGPSWNGLDSAQGGLDLGLPPGFTASVFADKVGFPTGLTYSSGGAFGNNLYVGDAGSTGGTGTILRFDNRATRSTFATNITGSIALAIDPSGTFGGDLHVINALISSPDLPAPNSHEIGDGTIKKVKSDGNFSTFSLSGVDAVVNLNLAFGTGGGFGSDLYVSSVFPRGRILRIKSDGSGSQLALMRSENNLGPVGLAFGPGGQFGANLFVSDPPTNKIVKIDSAGMATDFVSNVSGVVSLAFDRGGAFGGDLFAASFTPDTAGGLISNSGQGKILRIKPDGTFTTFAGGLRLRSFFSGDITFGFNGDLFVAEDGMNRILRITSSAVQGPSINLSPTSLDFGSVNVGQTADRTLTVSNSGNATLTVSSITSSNGRFSVVSPNTPFTVAAGGQQVVTVRFAPNANGVQSGTLTVSSNDPNRPIISVPLTGTTGGTGAPVIDVMPASLDFGSVGVGLTKELAVTVRNTGNVPLTVNSIVSSNTQFSVTSPTSPFTVAPAGQQVLSVRFAPTSAGPQSGALAISSNDPTRPTVTVPIAGSGGGTAGPAAIDVTPASLDFGSVAVGQSKDLTLAVRNTGSAALTVNSIVSSNTQFSATAPSTPFTVAGGGQQAVNVRFAPTSAGPQSGSLAISSNDPARATVTVPITGSGGGGAGGPAIDVMPTSLDFGSVAVGQNKELSLTVRNTGNAALTVGSVVSSNPLFNVTSPAIPFTVTTGGQQAITVRFSPTSAGTQGASIAISSNDPARPTVNVPMIGNGGTAGGGRTLSAPNLQGSAGTTVSVPINLSDGGGVSALRFVLTFDPAILSVPNPQALSRGSLLPANFSLSANTATPGQVTVLITPPIQTPLPSLLGGNGTVAVIAFGVAPAAADAATSPLRLTVASGSDPGGESVQITRQDGVFTVRNILLGDVNQDGKVNEQDVIRLILHLTGENPLTGMGLRAADTNCDGQVNEQDLVRLILHLTGEKPLPRSCPASIDPASVPSPYGERTLSIGKPGSDEAGVLIPMELDEGKDITAVGLSLKYDPLLITMTDVFAGELVSEGFTIYATMMQPGDLHIVIVPPVVSPIPTLRSGAGSLVELRLHVANAENPDQAIKSLKVEKVILVDRETRIIRCNSSLGR